MKRKGNGRYSCVTGECTWSGSWDEWVNVHIVECVYVLIKCKECKAEIERGKQRIHDAECPMAMVKCEICEEEMLRECLEDHRNEDCLW